MKIVIKKIKTAKNLTKTGDFKKIYYSLKKFLFGYRFARKSEFVYLVDENEIKPKFEKALLYLKNEFKDEINIGDYMEFGVSHGSSMLYMYDTLKKLKIDSVKLYGFDSFEGLPPEAASDDNGVWKPGAFYAKYKNVKKYLTANGIDWKRVHLIKGWFKDTLNQNTIKQFKINKISIIMIDCDLYSATKEALNFCKLLITDKTIIFFDDWNSGGLAEKNLGEKKAFDEFMDENPHLEAVDFDSYLFKGQPNGEIKLVYPKKHLC